ncbi:MAG: V-type ATPase 116kDa subunit family protein [Candidatus Micrarchaeota archaeon]
MLSLEEMQKVRIILPKEKAERGIEALYDFGAIEVRECKAGDLDRPLQSFERISEMLIKLRAVQKTLALSGAAEAQPASLAECSRQYASLRLVELDGIQLQRADLKSRRERLASRRQELLPFRMLVVPPKELASGSLRFAYFKLKPGAFKEFKLGLKDVGHELLAVKDGRDEYALLAFDSRREAEANVLVLKHASAVYPLPQSSKPFGAELRDTDAEIASVDKSMQRQDALQQEYLKKNGQRILTLIARLEILALKAELPFKFGKTKYFSVAEGWIEKKKLRPFEARIAKLPNTLVETVETSEVPPSKLDNPALVRPFEFLVEFFSLPKSYEIDPTLFISISFPIFFGMILGDIGYGLVLFIAALAIKLRSKSVLLKRIAGMLALSALSAIAFGFVFAEFFGLEHIFGMELHPMLHRIEESAALINLSIFIGALHVAVGLVIGAAVKARERHFGHAVAKLAWLWVELSLIALVVQFSEISLLEFLKPLGAVIPYPFSAALMVLSLALIARLESPTNLLELPGLISNVLSYLRIAALGIGAVVLVMIINQLPVDFDRFFAMATLQQPFDLGFLLSFFAFLAILVIGHIGALALGMFEAAIQTLRLHYVEFFSKFYEGGGMPFKPLRKDALD